MRLSAILFVSLFCLPSVAMSFESCSGSDRAARRVTCLVDGDTGWEKGEKWRLLDIDTPEIDHHACPAELAKGREALARLGTLMDRGYSIAWQGKRDRSGRKLIHIVTADGKDAGRVLLREGLAQPWPNTGNIWCRGAGN